MKIIQIYLKKVVRGRANLVLLAVLRVMEQVILMTLIDIIIIIGILELLFNNIS